MSTGKGARYARDLSVHIVHTAHMDTEWFKARKKALKVTDAKIAAEMHIDRTRVTRLLNGEGDLTLRRVEILARMLQVSRDEIMQRAGITEPAADIQPLDMGRAPDQPPTRSAYGDAGPVQLRRVNLELAMGDGTSLDDWIEEVPYDFDASKLREITSTPARRLLIGKGIGDSMEPTIGSHDDVMINLDENELGRFDGIYAMTIEGAGAIKRLSPAGQGMVEVISDNPNHPNRVRTFPRSAIRIIGRITWSARRH